MDGTQAIGRATDILRAVAGMQRSGATLAKIGRATNLSRSTAFRILHALKDEGLLQHDPQTRRYCIGPLAYELGLAAQGQAELITRWRSRLDRLSLRTSLTTYFVVRSDSDVVCLATAEGNSVIRAVPLVIGQRLPLGVGAGSLAILASLSDAEIDAILSANAAKLSLYGGGRLTRAFLQERINVTRERGYAFSKDTVSAGVLGVGVAISPPTELKQLAISVSMAAPQLDNAEQGRLANAIRDTASPFPD